MSRPDHLCLYLCFHLCFTYGVVVANQFSPHVFPKSGPYFEGWYMRLIDTDKGISVGLLFGHVLPKKTNSSNPLVVASVLFSRGCSTCKLLSFDAFFNISQVNLTVDGHPVTSNPDDRSPAVFSWTVGSNITFNVQGNTTQFAFYIGGAIFRGRVSAPVPWGPRGEGPEGWLEKLPLPLHWFVYSLNSPVDNYEFAIPDQGLHYSGFNAVAHMEKNWGQSFPPAWIWAEGVDASNNITLALSGGLVPFEVLTVSAYLLGYRNPDKSLVLNFKPTDSIVKTIHDGCAGHVNISAIGLVHQLYIYIESDPAAFSDCLYGPEETGFRPVCVESYSAVADIAVYKADMKIDSQQIKNFALEFGGKYVCNNKCSHTYNRN